MTVHGGFSAFRCLVRQPQVEICLRAVLPLHPEKAVRIRRGILLCNRWCLSWNGVSAVFHALCLTYQVQRKMIS